MTPSRKRTLYVVYLQIFFLLLAHFGFHFGIVPTFAGAAVASIFFVLASFKAFPNPRNEKR